MRAWLVNALLGSKFPDLGGRLPGCESSDCVGRVQFSAEFAGGKQCAERTGDSSAGSPAAADALLAAAVGALWEFCGVPVRPAELSLPAACISTLVQFEQ